ncbi:MAG: hypothetical protein ABGW69_01250 [Nanoarchaeota archaeon]
MVDSKGVEHYLLPKFKIGDQTYYLPLIVIIKEPGIGEVSVKTGINLPIKLCDSLFDNTLLLLKRNSR